MNPKLTAALCLPAAALLLCTACSSSSSGPELSQNAADETALIPNESSADQTDVSDRQAAAPKEIEFEPQVEAGEGDAILAITDKDWYVQYWGNKDSILTYDAGIAHITGDGEYTVSVNAGTKGAQFDITGDTEKNYFCKGVDFAVVKVLDGTTLYPDMCIDIKKIRVDGKEIPLSAKNYTSSDDGAEMHANIYNHFISSFPEDAHSPEGAVTGEFGDYNPIITDAKYFAKWQKIEVTFEVTGTGAETDENADAPT